MIETAVDSALAGRLPEPTLTATPTGVTDALTRNPVFAVRNAEGAVVATMRTAATAEEAVSKMRRALEARGSARVPVEACQEGDSAPSRSTDWKIFRGSVSCIDDDDGFLYHVTSWPNARRIIVEGLRAGMSSGFGAAYAGHIEGRVFVTERAGVNFWRERVEAVLHATFDCPPAVAVLRIPRDRLPELALDELGSRDARAKAYSCSPRPLPAQNAPSGEGGVPVGWFGRSQITDTDGSPLVVFHGTRAGAFSEFKPRVRRGEQLGFGIHFARDRSFALRYALDPQVARRGKDPVIHAAYLRMLNGLKANTIATEGDDAFELGERLSNGRLPLPLDEEGRRCVYLQTAIDATSPQRAERLIRDAGYDGVIYTSRIGQRAVGGAIVTGASESFIAFEPSQIKVREIIRLAANRNVSAARSAP